jgi:hypothetical protein
LRNLAPFAIGNVIKKLNRIHVRIRDKYDRPFPKPEAFWLSEYTYQHRYIRIHPDGRIVGGLSRFVTSLIDFSFVRSIVAHKYCLTGFGYDPVTLFLLELFRYLEKYPTMKDFMNIVRDKDRGKHYRLYAGITSRVPSDGSFTHLKDRLGEKLWYRSKGLAWCQFNRADGDGKVTLDAKFVQPKLLPFAPGILLEHDHLG